MTGVIKFSDAAKASVRSLATRTHDLSEPQAPPVVDPELTALREEVSGLRADIERREAEAADLRRDIDRALIDGEAAGRKAGQEEANDRQAERLAALQAGVAEATQSFADQISSLERLAALLAHESLGKILGDERHYADLLTRALRVRLDEIEARAVISVEVSRTDFPDPSRLASLSAAVGHPELDIRACEDLNSGGCRVRLRLGALEIGIGQQWERLGEALLGLAQPEVDG